MMKALFARALEQTYFTECDLYCTGVDVNRQNRQNSIFHQELLGPSGCSERRASSPVEWRRRDKI